MVMPSTVAIHQPNFFPWLGYFDKIRQADIFVFLDAVSYPKSGSHGMGSWTNRVRIAVHGQPGWIGCPVRRIKLGTPVHAAEIDDAQPWRTKLLKTLDANYRRAPNYKKAISWLQPLIETPETNLARFNTNAICRISAELGLRPPVLLQSQLVCKGHGTELLISLVKAVGGDAYLAGGGAAGYQKDDLFAERGVRLRMQDFRQEVYGDPDRFLPGLSVIDYLMRDGRPLAEAFPRPTAEATPL